MNDKVIVTNGKALLEKYSSEGLVAIRKALDVLITADQKRGIDTKIIYIDDEKNMQEMNGVNVSNVLNYRENKQAIDTVYSFLNPDYLVILGAPDIIPHQDLDNPCFYPGGKDGDRYAWGDLPYACDAPYSKDPREFFGPTRVVGRIPDLVGANEPSFLLSIIKTAIEYESRPSESYLDYFALSAEVWKGSTKMSIQNIFGDADNLMLAPPSGPAYVDGQLRKLMHFINCHGSLARPEFYGEGGLEKPVTLSTQSTIGEISKGTVVAAECCYGAELYDSITLSLDKGICLSYLLQGGYGFFGSTTIAYGPKNDNGAADLICQFFLKNVLKGSSIGMAALMARQQFVNEVAQMDPMDLKTIAQFYLLGDPSIHPVSKPESEIIKTDTEISETHRFLRSERREKMKQMGNFLVHTKPSVSTGTLVSDTASHMHNTLSNILKRADLPDDQKFIAFSVKNPYQGTNDSKLMGIPSRYLISIGIPKNAKDENINLGVAVVAKELEGRIVDFRIYYQR